MFERKINTSKVMQGAAIGPSLEDQLIAANKGAMSSDDPYLQVSAAVMDPNAMPENDPLPGGVTAVLDDVNAPPADPVASDEVQDFVGRKDDTPRVLELSVKTVTVPGGAPHTDITATIFGATGYEKKRRVYPGGNMSAMQIADHLLDMAKW